MLSKARRRAPHLRLAKPGGLLALLLSLIGLSSLKRGCRRDGRVVPREARPTIHWHGQRSLRLRTRPGQTTLRGTATRSSCVTQTQQSLCGRPGDGSDRGFRSWPTERAPNPPERSGARSRQNALAHASVQSAHPTSGARRAALRSRVPPRSPMHDLKVTRS
jgi:hypothetical protein